MSDPLMETRLDVSTECSRAMRLAAGKVLAEYGNDPQSNVILLAATTHMLDQFEIILPGFKASVRKMLDGDTK